MNRMKKIAALVAALSVMSGCFSGDEAATIGVIGGADGPTAIYIAPKDAAASDSSTEEQLAGEVSSENSQSASRILPPRTPSSAKTSSEKVVSVPSAHASGQAQEKMTVTFSQDRVPIGDLMMITVKGAKEKVKAKTNLALTPTFFKDDAGVQRAVLPVSYKSTPGTYTLTLTADGQSQDFTIQADDKEFVVQHLTVNQSTTNATVANDKANQEWNEKIEPLKYISDPEKYWSGAFVQPVKGRITTQYASQRYTNGGKTPTYHGGVDIAAATGTPIVATGAGRVQFADFIAMTGYTIIIEHGYGLKSFYYHMNGVNVKAGDMLEQGQQIGTVGSTGFSTGPHLHFAMAVNTVYTNPWPLFEQELK